MGQEMGFSKPGAGCLHGALAAQSCPPKPRGTLQQELRAWLVSEGSRPQKNPLSQVSRCRSFNIQGQGFAKVHPFMVHKGLPPRPGVSPAPGGEAPGAVGCPGFRQAVRPEPWKTFAPKQSIAFFKTCYKPSAQLQRWVPVAPAMLAAAGGAPTAGPKPMTQIIWKCKLAEDTECCYSSIKGAHYLILIIFSSSCFLMISI